MALAKISFEIEVEDTFQNGTKVNTGRIHALLAQVAEEEYNHQFDANKLVRRFAFKKVEENEGTTEITTTTAEEQPVEIEAEEATSEIRDLSNAEVVARRRNRTPMTTVAGGVGSLFLPK